MPKNIATSIKDNRFLDFFFSQVRAVGAREIQILEQHGIVDDYPFVSPCGKELNFIRPAATPIVFHSLVNDNSKLVYGGNMKQPFDPSMLAISVNTGRLYHRLDSKSRKISSAKENHPLLRYALIRSAVAIALSENIVESSDCETISFMTPEGPCPIATLPSEAEPTGWGLPYMENEAEE